MRSHVVFPALLSVLIGFGAPAMAQDQDQTLADIRQEMSVLFVEVQRLKRELSTTGGAASPAVGGTALERIDAIEAQLQRLTQKAEQLENRINQVVSDGTNRLGDLEFRLCELEKGCDIGKLGETSTLGGGALPAAPAPAPQPAAPNTPELAVSERADYDRAKAALDAGDYRNAADLFSAFTQTYPGGPLSSQAHFQRGEALRELGETAPAARAYLESFSGAPSGETAPQALYKLGISLGDLGQTREACVTLGEVGVRFPGNAAVAQAESARQGLGCN
ncbi:tol-pal system protein YbgF [Actibacterium ureilyticum]|uniref:tol-pal system protein YbgF n=1 Tax=Actibacterium ureilyticum TaxID=1590614 RepID=UPI000BAA9977|nr:tol-pal system protein YbgF [Actibacterium ureilyticum]